MKTKYTLLSIYFILSSFNLFSQIKVKRKDVIGKWIKVKTEMKDGSKLIPIYTDYISHFEMIFEKGKFHTEYYPAQSYKNSTSSYKIKKNRIISKEHFTYKIEKISRDSLIICEEMEGFENDKLKRHFLIKKEIISKEQRKKNEDIKSLTANPFYTPKFKGNINLYLNSRLMKRHINLKLKGQLKLDLKKNRAKTKITFRDSPILLMQEKILIKALNNSYTLWNLSGFEKFESIIINFVIILERKGEKSYGIKVGLLTNSFEQLLGQYGLSYYQIKKGNEYLKLGLESINNKNFRKAIDYFTESFKFNHTLVESLYNKAYCHFILKEYNKACIDWNILKNLGQKKGEKLFSEYCKIVE